MSCGSNGRFFREDVCLAKTARLGALATRLAAACSHRRSYGPAVRAALRASATSRRVVALLVELADVEVWARNDRPVRRAAASFTPAKREALRPLIAAPRLS